MKAPKKRPWNPNKRFAPSVSVDHWRRKFPGSRPKKKGTSRGKHKRPK